MEATTAPNNDGGGEFGRIQLTIGIVNLESLERQPRRIALRYETCESVMKNLVGIRSIRIKGFVELRRFFVGAASLLLGVTLVHSRDLPDVATDFELANQLYETGDYSEAALAYQALLDQGNISSAVYFNAGNAHFKARQIGLAIANYRLAERLSPRSPDVKANLRFARNSVGGAAYPQLSPFHGVSSFLTLNELTLIASAALWIWFACLIGVELRPHLARKLKPVSTVFGASSLILWIWLASLFILKRSTQFAVVVERDAVVRYGPLDESQSVYSPADGMEVTVLSRKDDWARIEDSIGRSGWIRDRKIVVLPSL